MSAYQSIMFERSRQKKKWGTQRVDWAEWNAILSEEMGEVAKEAVEEHFRPTGDLSKLREELIQVAAVAVAWVEHIDEVDPQAEWRNKELPSISTFGQRPHTTIRTYVKDKE